MTDTGHPESAPTSPEVLGEGPLPADLWAAFLAYDRALLSNDVPALDASFAPGELTLRADHTGVLVGHDAIAAFRAGRPAAPERRLVRVHVRLPADDVALLVAEVASPAGAPGLQTQLWQRVAGRWRVAAAHVTAPPRPARDRPVDGAVWRVVGAPLVAASATGPLTGETVAVKDLFAVAGQAVGAGVPAFLAEGRPAAEHAAAVAALLAAGASVTGLAQTDEFAYSVSGLGGHWGTPAHPTAPGRVPGGSTNGPGVAVARGEVSVGLGTDTAGSIRVPGSYLGLWGLRTSTGRVDTRGLLPLAPSFDAVGWLTRDGATLYAVARTLVPEGPEDGQDALGEHPEVCTVPALNALADPEIARGVEAAARALAARPLDLGVDLGAELAGWYAAFRTVQGFEAWRAHGAWVTEHPGALSAEVAARMAWAATVTEDQQAAARVELDRAAGLLRAGLAGRVLLLPSTATPAPPAADPAALAAARDRTLQLTCLASLAGLPALTLPAPTSAPTPAPEPTPAHPTTAQGSAAGSPLPYGLGLVGPAGSDLALIRFALGAAATLTGRPTPVTEDIR
ncbi:DUF3225 domain-containing protein [Streptomyces sp. DSM 44915]|uniref:DUF3225 domain-containing protein n=1 Tax=Streptomyces chisholmiae TaxID=3075540 RepID=A0ABU2JIM5_9ACTN|nr:AtzH-like domain-containing protein [Streptomyces sp. DSM 44915]MDT0264830.1 DUF3225 domain-containing protein [Streptomyces sp. DSM 44915]